MKKIFLLSLLLAIVGIMATGCSSCQSEKQQQENVAVGGSDTDGIIPEITASVENIIALDRQTMYHVTNGGNYRWFETTVLYTDYLDSDVNADEVNILSITNTFQTVIEKEGGLDTKVYMFETTGKGKSQAIYNTFMLENHPLNEVAINLTFEAAYNKLMEANIAKPHSRYCVLRKPVGPNMCNPQYIFGNRKAQVYVDAVTGNVSAENPAFSKEPFVGLPLGEWP